MCVLYFGARNWTWHSRVVSPVLSQLEHAVVADVWTWPFWLAGCYSVLGKVVSAWEVHESGGALK